MSLADPVVTRKLRSTGLADYQCTGDNYYQWHELWQVVSRLPNRSTVPTLAEITHGALVERLIGDEEPDTTLPIPCLRKSK